METIFVIAAIVFLVVYLLAQDSKKETTREKYGEAIGQVVHSAASTIAIGSILNNRFIIKVA